MNRSLAIASAAAAGLVTAAEPAPARAADVMPVFTAGGRVGGLFGQPFSTLGSSFVGELQGGFQLAVWQRRLGLFLAGSYSQPKTSGSAMDPRLTGGTETYTTTLRDLGIAGGPSLWLPLTPLLIPYGQVGPKLHLYRDDDEGRAGSASFGENRESKTRVGFLARAGLAVRLGPGAATGDVSLDWAPVREVITGRANAGDLVVALGYTLFL